jgi:hypothetical protein
MTTRQEQRPALRTMPCMGVIDVVGDAMRRNPVLARA